MISAKKFNNFRYVNPKPLKQLRTLLVTFNNSIGSNQISAFRGAVVRKVGKENSLFHNHLNEEQLAYRYPLIQYKRLFDQPAIFCVAAGVDEIHRLFEKKDWTIQLADQKINLEVDRLDLKSSKLNVWDKLFPYRISNWLALNHQNYQKYTQLNGLKEKIAFLERLLTGNILSFAKGIDWQIEKPIKVEIRDLKGQKMVKYKGTPLMAFDVDFNCNVFLPNYLGLGKSASHGFGVVRQIKNSKQELL